MFLELMLVVLVLILPILYVSTPFLGIRKRPKLFCLDPLFYLQMNYKTSVGLSVKVPSIALNITDSGT